MNPSKAQLRKLAEKIADYNSRNASKILMDRQVETMKKELEATKAEIIQMVEPYADQFIDGEWIVLDPDAANRVGTLKAKFSSPKLVLADSEKKPSDAQVAKLVKAIPKRYVGVKLNLAQMRESMETDEALAKALTEVGVTVVRSVEYEVKL
ncbi:hypothetical protein ACAW74_25820 [Fibrella sp. WM1]|uniref:hypothetical protein n=1 Tax=Fibrella musci TaxID=3242485 RepID=UPI00351FFE78